MVKKLLNELKDLQLSISVTTRPPRNGEVDGGDYFFATRKEFERGIREDGFLEWAEVHGNFYGTPRSFVEMALSKGKSVILEIDVQGALQVLTKMPDARLIFILPPSMEELERRLMERNTDSREVIAKRLEAARREMGFREAYHYRIVNDDLSEAYHRLKNVILREIS